MDAEVHFVLDDKNIYVRYRYVNVTNSRLTFSSCTRCVKLLWTQAKDSLSLSWFVVFSLSTVDAAHACFPMFRFLRALLTALLTHCWYSLHLWGCIAPIRFAWIAIWSSQKFFYSRKAKQTLEHQNIIVSLCSQIFPVWNQIRPWVWNVNSIYVAWSRTWWWVTLPRQRHWNIRHIAGCHGRIHIKFFPKTFEYLYYIRPIQHHLPI